MASVSSRGGFGGGLRSWLAPGEMIQPTDLTIAVVTISIEQTGPGSGKRVRYFGCG